MQKISRKQPVLNGLKATILTVTVISCAGGSHSESLKKEGLPAAVAVSSESHLMFDVLAAELAGRRGMLDVAADNYLQAANKTDDPRVADRATKLAIYGRNWPQAETAGKRWAQLQPDNLEARQLLAQVQLNIGEVKGATESLVGLIEYSRNTDVGMKSAVSTLLHDNNHRAVSEVLVSLDKLYPDNYLLHYAMSREAIKANTFEPALKSVDYSLKLNPDFVDSILLRSRLLVDVGQAEEGFGFLRSNIKRSPEDKELRIGLARLLVDKKQYDEASLEFDAIAELSKDDAASLYALSLLAVESRRTAYAEKYLKAVLATGEYQDGANYFLGRIAENKQEFELALVHYEQIQEGENVLDAQIRAAQIYGLMGQVDRGRDRLHRLHMLVSDELSQIRIILIEGRMLRDAGRYAESLQVFGKGLEAFPEDIEMLYAHALSAEKLELDDVFEKDLRKVIKLDPGNAHALNALGYFMVDRGSNLDEAEKYLKKAILLVPGDPAITDSLGWLKYRQGNYEQALKLLKEAFDVLGDPEIAAHLGEVLWVTGDHESATVVWNKGLEYKPVSEAGSGLLKDVMKKYIQ